MIDKKDEALRLALEALENTTPTGFNMERDKQFFAAITSIKEALAEQPAQQQSAERVEPVQTTPNFEQLKQIFDNLDRCHHRESKQEFLRTWIRDWTEHKQAKYTSPPASKPLTDDEIAEATQDIGLSSPLARWRIARAIEAAHGIKENT